MDESLRRQLKEFSSGLEGVLAPLARRPCAPFWWNSRLEGGEKILGHGSVTFIQTTGHELIGVTADHVLQQYLKHKETYEVSSSLCGGTPFGPEDHLLDRDSRVDLATFDASKPFLANDQLFAYRTGDLAQIGKWPPDRISEGEMVAVGGFPVMFRRPHEHRRAVEFSFQVCLLRVADITDERIVVHIARDNVLAPELDTPDGFKWEFFGMSGGPVYRYNESERGEIRLDMVGFVSEVFESEDIVIARHIDTIRADGTIVRPIR